MSTETIDIVTKIGEAEVSIANEADRLKPHISYLTKRYENGDIDRDAWEVGIEVLIETHGQLHIDVGGKPRQLDFEPDESTARYVQDAGFEGICGCGGLLYEKKTSCWRCRSE